MVSIRVPKKVLTYGDTARRNRLSSDLGARAVCGAWHSLHLGQTLVLTC